MKREKLEISREKDSRKKREKRYPEREREKSEKITGYSGMQLYKIYPEGRRGEKREK